MRAQIGPDRRQVVELLVIDLVGDVTDTAQFFQIVDPANRPLAFNEFLAGIEVQFVIGDLAGLEAPRRAPSRRRTPRKVLRSK